MKRYIIICGLFLSVSPASARGVPSALYKSYMATIRNSIGARTFRQLYLYDKDANRVVEVLGNGNLSCAYFASSVLRHFGLAENYHDSIDDTLADMGRSGWKPRDVLVPGSVIVWEGRYFKKSKSKHAHIGFFIGPGRAVSNSSRLGFPVIHNLRPDGRKIVKILWHPRLSPEK